MRIGFSYEAADLGLNPQGIDGRGVYARDLYQALKQQGVCVTPFVYRHDRRYAHCLTQAGQAFHETFLGQTLTSFIPGYPRPDWRKAIDVYHASDHFIPRLHKMPVVATVHDAIMLKHPQWCSPTLRQLKNWVFKRTTHYAKKIIAISHAAVPDLMEYFKIPEKKISVVHHGVDPVWKNPISQDIKQARLSQFNLKKDYILFVGTLQPRKNILRIIQAFSRLPEDLRRQHPLVLVGKNGWETDELMRVLSEWEKSRQIIWLKQVDFQLLRILYQNAKVLCFPSLYEGFGFPILEAFSSQIPVITSNITAMPEIAGDAALLVDPYSIDDIHQALEKILTDQQTVDLLIQKGLARLPLFSWEKCAKETLAVYQSAM